MEQRKLNDQANSLVDLAKVSYTNSVLLPLWVSFLCVAEFDACSLNR